MGNKLKTNTNINNTNNNDPSKLKYFSFLKRAFIYHQNIINNYKSNLELAFIKNFKDSNKNSIEKFRIGLGWKKYLIDFFKKQVKIGHEFYSDIIVDINKEKFGFENKYLSFMFYLDYEKTYILNNKGSNIQNYIIKEDDLDYENELKFRLSRNSSAYYMPPETERRSSIVLPTNGEENNTFNLSFEKKQLKQECNYLIKLIKTQIEEREHPINIVIAIFEKHISNLIHNFIDSFKNSNENENENESENESFIKNIEKLNNTLIHNILKFTSKIHTAVKLFYMNVFHLDCLMEEKDELINIIMGILFNTGVLYSKINDLFSLQYKNDLAEFQYKLKAIQNLKPKDIQIDDKFCLDENTDNIIKNLKKKSKNNKEIMNIENDSGIFSDLFKKNKNKRDKSDGYKSAIQKLKNELPKINSPYKKMMLIASISTEITECIDNYWEAEEDIIPNSNYLQVTSDELLKIFIYIVVQSQLPDLIIHEAIIQKFTFEITQNSMIGFYNSTLDAAINYIQKNLLKDVKITEEFKTSFMGSLTSEIKSKYNIDYNMDLGISRNSKLYESIDKDFYLDEGNGKEIENKNIKSIKSKESDSYSGKKRNNKIKMFDNLKNNK